MSGLLDSLSNIDRGLSTANRISRDVERTTDSVGRAQGAIQGYGGTVDEANYRRKANGDRAYNSYERAHEQRMASENGGQQQGYGGQGYGGYGGQQQYGSYGSQPQYGHAQPQFGGGRNASTGPVDQLVYAVADATAHPSDEAKKATALQLANQFPHTSMGIMVKGRADVQYEGQDISQSFNGGGFSSPESIVANISKTVARRLQVPPLTQDQLGGTVDAGYTPPPRSQGRDGDGQAQTRPTSYTPSTGSTASQGGDESPAPQTGGATPPPRGHAAPPAHSTAAPAHGGGRPATHGETPAPAAATDAAPDHGTAKNYGAGTSMPPINAEQVTVIQEAMGGKSTMTKHGADGKWGPETQRVFLHACEAAGVKPEEVNFAKNSDAAQKFTTYLKEHPLVKAAPAPEAPTHVAAPAHVAAPVHEAPSHVAAPSHQTPAAAAPAPVAAPVTPTLVAEHVGMTEHQLRLVNATWHEAQALKTDAPANAAHHADAMVKNMHELAGVEGKITFKTGYKVTSGDAHLDIPAGTYSMEQLGERVGKTVGLNHDQYAQTQAAEARYEATLKAFTTPPAHTPMVMASAQAPTTTQELAAEAPAKIAPRAAIYTPPSTELFGGSGFTNAASTQTVDAPAAVRAPVVLASVTQDTSHNHQVGDLAAPQFATGQGAGKPVGRQA